MLGSILRKITSLPLTIESWTLSAIGIIFIRIFLEHYSSNEAGRFVLIDASTIIHYSTFFIAVLLVSTLIVMSFSKQPLKESATIALFGFMIIWLPPLLDLIVSWGAGYTMHYLFLLPKDLLTAFLTMFWSTADTGITYGIRIEIALVVISSFAIIYFYTKSILKSLSASVLLYACIFALVSLPSMLGLFQKQPIPHFVSTSILNSRIIGNSSYPAQSSYERVLDVSFNSLMTQVNLAIILAIGILICAIGYREKLKVLLRNSRPERILHYSILIIIGTLFGGGPLFYLSWVNVLSTIATIAAFVFAWLVAVCINDIYDKEIDEISNTNRPLPQGSFSKGEFYSLSVVFTILSFIAAYSSSMYGLFFVLTFSFAYYIYSVEPLRLKRHYITGALVIGFASTSAVLAGFFLSNNQKEFLAFNPLLTILLITLFSFGSMVRDIKDYEGDKLNGISTLPVKIGLKKAKIIIATAISLGMLWVAYYFESILLTIVAISCSLFIWKTFFAYVYRERNFFITYLFFLLVFIATFILR
ncbi:MAG: UbiA family prenyltransferase [Patescibacteria group bacterium]